MDFLRRTINQIKTQLGTLSISGKLVLILLMVIMTGAILQMARYAAEREMVVLLNQDFTEDELNTIANQLSQWEEKFEIKGNRIWVPQSSQKKLISRLAYKELLPEDTSEGWSYILENNDMFSSESSREDGKKIILQKMLARTIADSYPEVDKATVYINKGNKRRLNNITPAATASVSVTLNQGASSSRKLASSIAALVSGAVNRLKRENVQVIVNGKLIAVSGADDELASEYLEEKAKNEDYYRSKIINSLPPGINAIVQVDVALQNTASETHTKRIAGDGEGSLIVKKEESTRETSSSSGTKQEEPGLVANAAGAGRNNGGMLQKESSEQSESSKQVYPGSTEKIEVTGKGGIKEITASVSIDESYFKDKAKLESGSEEEPDIELVKVVTTREITKIKQIVMRAIGLRETEDESCVVVGTYWAPGVTASSGGVGGGGVGGGGGADRAKSLSVSGLAGRYGKHIAVSSLALISLFMMLMMVKKGSTTIEMDEEEAAVIMSGKKPAEALSLEESNLVEGIDDSGLLSGMELDRDVVRTQQVLEQIKTMVSESPADAANLVGKWIAQDI